MLCARVMRGISSIENAVTPRLREHADRIRRAERIGEADDRLSLPQPAGLGRHRADLENDVGGREHGVARRDRRARLLVGRGRKSGRAPGVLFDDDVEAAFLERRDGGGNQGDPVFAGPRFTRDSDLHGRSLTQFPAASFGSSSELELLDPLGDGCGDLWARPVSDRRRGREPLRPAGAFLRARASSASRSASAGGTLRSRSPWTMSSGCFTFGMTCAGS